MMQSRHWKPFARVAAFAAMAAVAAMGAGCTATGGSAATEGARQPVSMEVPTSETRQRAKVHTELGLLYMQDGRYAVALEEARIALSADAAYAPAYNLLALTHMLLRENKLAEENFERAMRHAPGDPEIENNYGWFLCQTNREQRAMDLFQRSARNPLYPTPANPLTNAGICSARIKDNTAAEGFLQRAVQLDPANTLAIFWSAEVAYRTEQYADAQRRIKDLERIVELNAEASWLALRIERKLGNRDGEARHAAQLRRKFATSEEHRKLQQGEYE